MYSKGILAIVSLALILASCRPTLNPNPAEAKCDLITQPVMHVEKKDQALAEEIEVTALIKTAEYRVELAMGPGKKIVTAVIDTGSSAPIIAAPDCEGSCDSNQTYAPIGNIIEADVSLIYGSGSASGDVYNDQIGFACGPPAQVNYVSINKSTVPNIMGLASKTLLTRTGIPGNTLFAQLLAANRELKPMFSFTACGQKKGSEFFMGGRDPRITAAFKCVKRTEGDFWNFKPISLKLTNGRVIPSGPSPKAPIADTGTTLTLLPKPQQDAMCDDVTNALALLGHTLPTDYCDNLERNPNSNYSIPLPAEVIAQLPTFQVVFEGCDGSNIEIDWTPEAYMREWSDDTYTFGVREVGAVGGDQIIFGQTFMDDKSTIFHQGNGTISFASNSEACTSLTQINE